MPASVFDVFRIGIGPSSSHTVGPMRAARRFLADCRECGALEHVAALRIELFGSLALTGIGHGSDRAILLGLSGAEPERIDPARIEGMIAVIRQGRVLALPGGRRIPFDPERDLVLRRDASLPRHPNALRFHALGAAGESLLAKIYYSVGGGAILAEDEPTNPAGAAPAWPHDYHSAAELLALAAAHGLSIARLAFENECALRPLHEVEAGIERLWQTMRECMERGLAATGELPGGLGLARRAGGLHRRLLARQEKAEPLHELDWIDAWAIAVNEENASGGRVVTAPTNGAAGIVPAVLMYYTRFHEGNAAGRRDFLLTAAAICSLYKENASISGAEVGCQGEIGVAASMAAAGLAAALGGSNAQIENAAEIGMEHNLGLTCDPVAGLVQVPCIERNAMGAVKAINAARLALGGDGRHFVSLDRVIATMRETGADMQSKYKETALGGLAVNVVNC